MRLNYGLILGNTPYPENRVSSFVLVFPKKYILYTRQAWLQEINFEEMVLEHKFEMHE